MLYRECMFDRTRRPLLVRVVVRSAMVCMMACSLVACSPDSEPIPTVSDTASSKLVFESDDVAQRIATETYGRYLQKSDEILRDGGQQPERINSLVVGAALSMAMSDFDEFRQANARLVGETGFSVVRMQGRRSAGNEEIVTLYLCNDVSKVDIRDAGGVSLVESARVPVSPFVITVVASNEENARVASKDLWEGSDFCSK